MRTISIGDDLDSEAPDYNQPPRFTWRQFYDFRNNVVRAFERFGSIGPSGQFELPPDAEEPEPATGGVADPDFFIVDDMYNEHDQVSIVECGVGLVNADLLLSQSAMASAFPGWCVVMNMGDCRLRIFSDRVLVAGRRFWDCKTVEEVGARCKSPVDYGPPPMSVDSMYPLWLDLICGEFPSRIYPEAPSREWREILATLSKLQLRDQGSTLDSSAYARIRYDIHPQTRRDFVVRALSEASSLGVRLRTAKQHIEQDSADALASSNFVQSRLEILKAIATGQRAAEHFLSAKEVLFWWPYIVDKIDAPDESLKLLLSTELQWLADNSSNWVQLSSIFALSRLGFDAVPALIDRALSSNSGWLASESLIKWLVNLRNGIIRYPSGLTLP